METENKYNVMINAFRNPTKLKIITLLTNHDKMTVTGMSKYIKTTRSNIYQNISELLKNNIVLEPEKKVKKNYVEKYYRLNNDFFDLDEFEIEDKILKLSNDDFRNLSKSFFLAQSMNLNILAEEIDNVSDENIDNIKTDVKNKIIMTYGSVSDKFSLELTRVYKNFIKKYDEENKNNKNEKDLNIFMFLIFPKIKW